MTANTARIEDVTTPRQLASVDDAMIETMNAPTKEHQMSTWDKLTGRAGWAVLIVFTALSSYLNARRVVLDGAADTELIVFHAAIPAVLLVAGLFAELVSMSSVHRTAKAVTVTGLVAVFGITLVASYLAILGVVVAWNPHAPAWVNAGLAAVPDIVMVMSGSVILSLRVRRHGLAPTAKKPSRKASPGRWSRIGDNLMSRAERLTEVREPQVTAVGHAARADEPQPPAQVNRAPAAHTGQAPRTTAHRDAAQPARPATQDAEPVQRPTPTEDHRIAAQRLVDAKRATQPVEVVAEVLAAADAGMSKREIETATGVPASTAARIVSRAKELEDTASKDSARVLAAVG